MMTVTKPDLDELIHQALLFANRGIPVFPVYTTWDVPSRKANKKPLTEHGHNNGSTDHETVIAMFKNAGVRCNAIGGYLGGARMFAIDIDPRDGGDETWEEVRGRGLVPDTVEVLTPSGGRHLWFRMTAQTITSRNGWKDGIDIKGDGGWVVLPGSVAPVNASGELGMYEFEAMGDLFAGVAVAPVPEWLGGSLPSTTGRGIGSHWRKVDLDDLHPADRAALVAVKEFGGHSEHLQVGGDGKETLYVTRPGKLSGTSASIGYVGPGIVKVFTSGWDGLPAGVYDADELGQMREKKAEEATRARGIELRWVNELTDDMPPAPEVYVEGLIRAGEMCVLGAPRAIGKSWLAMNLAAKLADGHGKLFDHLEVKRRANVLLLQGELDQWGSASRWEKLTGHKLPRVAESFDQGVRLRTTKRRTTQTIDGVVMSDEHIDAVLTPSLEETIVDHKIDVVIIDPWATYFSGNENSNDEVEAALSKLRGLTLRHGVAWVIFHHIGKSNEHREPEDAWRGASRLADWASTRITILPHYSEPKRKELKMERWQSRRYVNAYILRRAEPTPDFSMHLGLDGWWSHWTPDEADEGGRPAAVHLREFMNELVSVGGRFASMNAAASHLCVSRSVVQRLVDEAVKGGLVTLSGAPSLKAPRAITITSAGLDMADRPLVDDDRNDTSCLSETSLLSPLSERVSDKPDQDFCLSETPSATRRFPTSLTRDDALLETPPYYVGERPLQGAPSDDVAEIAPADNQPAPTTTPNLDHF
jgi:hypothetical protein